MVKVSSILHPKKLKFLSEFFTPIQVGLLSSAVGAMVYTVSGSVKEISLGPTAMMLLLTDIYRDELPQESTGLLTFGCCVVGFILSFLRLGKQPVCHQFEKSGSKFPVKGSVGYQSPKINTKVNSYWQQSNDSYLTLKTIHLKISTFFRQKILINLERTAAEKLAPKLHSTKNLRSQL